MYTDWANKFVEILNKINALHLILILPILVVFFIWFYNIVSASQWYMYLSCSECTQWTPVPSTPYNVDFWSFSAQSVYGVSKINPGEMRNPGSAWNSQLWWGIPQGPVFDSSIPLLTKSFFLAVVDWCGNSSWHADLVASDLVDQNVANSSLATSIPGANVQLTNTWLFFLENTPYTPEVSIVSMADYTSLWSPIQLLQRVYNWNEGPWIFWVRPTYQLIIPAYQQIDKYEWTISWTVMVDSVNQNDGNCGVSMSQEVNYCEWAEDYEICQECINGCYECKDEDCEYICKLQCQAQYNDLSWIIWCHIDDEGKLTIEEVACVECKSTCWECPSIGEEWRQACYECKVWCNIP